VTLLLLLLLFQLQMGLNPVTVVLNKTQHTNTRTHHTRTKHSTQHPKKDKGHTTHNEYNAKAINNTITMVLIQL
jgi:hypothetical protein